MSYDEKEDASRPTPVIMNWLHVTERLANEFRLKGSFVYNVADNDWIGVPPPLAFREYLTGLIHVKEPSYFTEIRFYKYTDERASDDQDGKRYLALIPIRLRDVPYQFLGLLYDSPEKLQDLLRTRIMPNYTLFWLYQLITEARVRNANQEGHRALVKALEEQRLYASRLESKIGHLNDEISQVRNAETTLDQKVDQLTDLLHRQMGEYGDLADRYQELFEEHQQLQNDYLSTCVRLETRINEMDRAELNQLVHETAPTAAAAPAETPAEDRSGPKIVALMERLRENNQELASLREHYDSLRNAYGGVTPTQVSQLLATVGELRKRVDYYKTRSEEQEQRLKKLNAKALAERRRGSGE